MRLIVAGSRTITNSSIVYDVLDALPFRPSEIVTGGAPGPDTFADLWAKNLGYPRRVFSADWDKLGKAAGPMRNQEMAEYAHGLLAFWQKRSAGTGDMIERARKKGLWIRVVEVGPLVRSAAPPRRWKGILSVAKDED